MKKPNRPLSAFCAWLLLLAAVLGCSRLADGPDWTKCRKIAGKAQGLSHISGMVIDDRSAYVIMGGTIADQNEGNSGVRKVSLETGEVTMIDDGIANFPQSDYGGMAVDDTHLYWKGGGNIMRAAKDDGKPEVIVTENVGIGIDLIVDEERVYWVNHGYYSPGQPAMPKPIFSAPKVGGKSEIFADEQMVPHSLAADEAFVYWLTRSALMKQAKSGGREQAVYRIGDKEGLDELSLDDDSLYFGHRGPGESRWAFRKVAKSGGEPLTLVKSYSLQPAAIDDDNVYFFDENSMYKEALCRVPKNGGEVARLDVGYSSGVIAQSKTQVYFAGGDDVLSFAK